MTEHTIRPGDVPSPASVDDRPVGKLMAPLYDRGHERRMFGISLNHERIEAEKLSSSHIYIL